jgi:hypothetical protein
LFVLNWTHFQTPLLLITITIIIMSPLMKWTSDLAAWLQWSHYSFCEHRDTWCTKKWVQNILEEGWCGSFPRYWLYSTRQCVCTVHSPPAYGFHLQDSGMGLYTDVIIGSQKYLTNSWKRERYVIGYRLRTTPTARRWAQWGFSWLPSLTSEASTCFSGTRDICSLNWTNLLSHVS